MTTPAARRRPDPDEAYHYQPLRDSEMMGWLERTLLQDQLYFSSPGSFNDPFDSKVIPSFDGTSEQKRTFLQRLSQQKFGTDSSAEARALVEGALSDPGYFERTYATVISTEVDKLGVYCLSEKNDDILMWSHYADAHRGFCLILALSNMFADLTIEPITYPERNQYPNVNFFNTPMSEQIDGTLLTKSKHWDYECEWRIVDTRGPGWHRIDPRWLRGLIFGCQVSPSKIAEVRRMGAQRRAPLTLFQSTKRYREFALDISPLA